MHGQPCGCERVQNRQPPDSMQVDRLGIDVEHETAGASRHPDTIPDRRSQGRSELGDVRGQAVPALA
jgi:hypothetical protein